jgi:subtilisin family serine protease
MLSRTRAALGAMVLLGLAACAEAPLQPGDTAAGPTLSLGRQQDDPVMAGEILVKVRPGADVAAVARGHGLQLAAAGYAGRFQVLRGVAGGERSAALGLSADPAIEWAEPNYLRQVTTINPNLWAFYNPGGLNMKYTSGANKGKPIPSSYASIADADEDNIEGYAAGGADVVIGSIDTGVDLTHPQFTGRLIAGRDWYNNDADPTDDDGHGSHTTGTMAGSSVGVAGVSGAAAQVRVLVQKVCGRRGCPTSAIVNAIYAAADYPNLVAMNLSLGGSTESQAEKDAINYAVNTKGVLVIASAGNSGAGSVACPACDVNAISVASTTWQDLRASYSQYGPGLDISAPGGNCYSNTTAEGCIYSAYKNGGYAWLQGTSMAAPQVTGTAAIVASMTGLRGASLRARLLSTTDDLGSAGYDQTFGNGRLNSYRAVTGGSLAGGN